MPEVRVQDEQGNIHVFPDGSTPEMISQAMGLGQSTSQPPPPQTYNPQRSPMDFIASAAGPAYALAGNPDVREFGKQMLQKATDPSLLFGATGLGQLYNQGKQLYSMAKGRTGPPSLAAAAGAVGVDPESVKRNAQTQNYPGLAADVAFPILSMKAGGKLGEVAPTLAPKAGMSLARSGVEAVLQPSAKQFRFGKDPVGFVVDNGIGANSLEELHNNIESKVNDRVQELDAALKQTPATVNLASAKKVVTNAIQDAMQKRDAATVGKLTDLYNRLSSRVVPGQNGVRSVPAPNSIPAWEAAQVKRGIQESINWSDQAAKPVNNVLMQVQHEIGDTLHKAVPETAALDDSISSGIEAKKAAETQWLKDQAGKRTFKNSTRATVGGALVGGAIGGPTGAAMGAGIGKFGAKALAYPTVGTYLSKVLGKP